MPRTTTRRLENPTVSVSDILDRICVYLGKSLKSGSVELNNNPRIPPRMRSALDQETISNALLNYTHASDWFKERGLSLEILGGTHWYAFAIHGRDLFLPINLKVSSLSGSSDNVSAKDGLFFALTGVNPAEINTSTWEAFCDALARNLSTNTSLDYFFLIVNKQQLGDCFWTSIKSLNQAQSNGNNLPFQCDWRENRNRIYRTHDDAARYLLGLLRQSFALRAEAYVSFQKHLDPILNPLPKTGKPR